MLTPDTHAAPTPVVPALRDARLVLIFGGSFDPPHLAHVLLPERARAALGADAIAYLPAGRHPLKPVRALAAPEHRLAMLRLAIHGNPWAHVLTDELDRADDGEPSYTVDTLEALRRRLGPSPRLRLLIGGDNLRVFDRWRRPERVIELAEPLVMVRPPDTRDTLLAALPTGFDPAEWRPRLVEVDAPGISSTEIRARLARGEPITGLVPPAVEQYIREHGLYAKSEPRA